MLDFASHITTQALMIIYDLCRTLYYDDDAIIINIHSYFIISIIHIQPLLVPLFHFWSDKSFHWNYFDRPMDQNTNWISIRTWSGVSPEDYEARTCAWVTYCICFLQYPVNPVADRCNISICLLPYYGYEKF